MRIAILLTTYNSEKYLAETLESVTAQQRRPDEMLIVDDGSTDMTPVLIAEWAVRQSFPVNVVRNRLEHDLEAGRGPAAGRMTGLQTTQAELVALLDHDDLLLPHHLRKLEQAFLDNPVLVLCFGDVRDFETNPNEGRGYMRGKAVGRLRYTESKDGLRLIEGSLYTSLLFDGSYIPTAANLWRRDAALAAGGFNPSAGTADDALLWMRLSRVGPCAYYPEILAAKRTHGENLSHPRYVTRLAWNSRTAFASMLEEPDRWRFNQEELEATRAAERRMSDEILYHASREGLAALEQARRRLNRPDVGLRRRLAAVYHGFRRQSA